MAQRKQPLETVQGPPGPEHPGQGTSCQATGESRTNATELEQERGLGQDKVLDTRTVSTPIYLRTPRWTQTHRHRDTHSLHLAHPTEPWQILPWVSPAAPSGDKAHGSMGAVGVTGPPGPRPPDLGLSDPGPRTSDLESPDLGLSASGPWTSGLDLGLPDLELRTADFEP